VVPPDFVFALALSGGASREMLLDLVARVLERAGSPGDGVAALGDELHAAVGRGPRDQIVDLHFSAAAGRLRIVVSSQSRALCQIERDIP
jgi:hypothetical protein